MGMGLELPAPPWEASSNVVIRNRRANEFHSLEESNMCSVENDFALERCHYRELEKQAGFCKWM